MARSSFVPHFYQPRVERPDLMRVAMIGWVIGFTGAVILAYVWRWATMIPG